MSVIRGHDDRSVPEDKRAQQVAAARKRLQTFRATRPIQQTSPSDSAFAFTSASVSSSSITQSIELPIAPDPSPMMPLTTEPSMNWHPPLSPPHSPTKGKGKELDGPVRPLTSHRHRRSDSQAHRRQRSSVAIPSDLAPVHSLARPSVMGVFDVQPPKQIITTPATPLLDPPHTVPEDADDERDVEQEQVAARLSAFSFGSKPTNATFPPKRRQQAMLPSQSLFPSDSSFSSTSPLSSPTSSSSAPNLNRLSTPSSRPPSLFLTRPTPLPLGSPSSNRNSRGSLSTSPSSPPTPARKRHSHTRSNSISLPNLQLPNTRPTSLGVPTSPGYMSSPSSPASAGEGTFKSRLGPVNGQRLKFEPSGRGAEAEKEKEESRRKALEKLTGGPPPPAMPEPFVSEISLPDLDDEDSSSVASSNRPLSGAFGSGSNFVFGRPSSLTLPPLSASVTSTPSTLSASPFSWSSPADELSPVERWSGSGFGLPIDPSRDEVRPFGIEKPPVMGKRPSLARQLSALAEVDESEEEGAEETEEAYPIESIPEEPFRESSPSSPQIEPTPSRLRELRLSTSSASASTPKQVDSSYESVGTPSFPRSAQPSAGSGSHSPTKGYGAIGRGRPNPHVSAGQSVTVFSSVTAMSTPKSAGGSNRRRAAPGSGSRGSSISYKRDDSISSSRDLSISSNSRMITSPTLMSPSASVDSPGFSGWGNMHRNAQRPCPRPRMLVGLGIDSAGSGRVLGEVDEEEEGESPNQHWTSPTTGASQDQARSFHGFDFQDGGRTSSELSRDSFEQAAQWRDVQLELEMERDAAREDAEMWKERCRKVEERLSAEKKEAAVLRDRVRKLGDRLSSVSSVPTERSASEHAAESRLIAEMREQLFNLTTTLEQERRAKEAALAKLADRRLAEAEESEDDELILTARPDEGALFPPAIIPSPMVASTSRAATPNSTDEESIQAGGDPNLLRMKGWGFPSTPSPSPPSSLSAKSRPKNKRESFFGLSNALRRSSHVENTCEQTGIDGIDLPPFVLTVPTPNTATALPTHLPQHGAIMPTQSYPSPSAQSQRAVSEPIANVTNLIIPAQRSTSTSHSATATASATSASASAAAAAATSSAISFLSGYLPIHHSDTSERSSATLSKYIPRFISKEEQRLPHASPVGRLDFSDGCQCCVGQLIEL